MTDPIAPSHADATVADLLAMRAVRVLVLGDALLDVYIDGTVDRISPEAPVPVLHEHGRRSVLGGAANVAANVAALGGEAVLVARVGDDAEGEEVARLAAAAGIDVGALIRSDAVPTVRKERLVAGGQQLARIDRERTDPLSPDEHERALVAVRGFLAEAGPRALVIADYAKGVIEESLIGEVLAAAVAAGVPVVADPKTTELGRYAGATVLKPNRREAVAAVGAAPAPELAERVLERSGCESVVLSLSDDGVFVAGAGVDQPIQLAAHALQVADVSGAGDTMVATLALALGAGVPLERGAQLANIAASKVCEKAGTATIGFSELLAAHRALAHEARPEKWLDADSAALVAERLRAEGRRLVFTNGCFDVLHAGHVALLAAARASGDALVVALNSDASVRRLKGPERPAVTLDDRVAVLAALGVVDFVVVFEEDTPLELLRVIRPAVLVKGGDYRAEDVVGGEDVVGWGGEVRIVPLLEGRSTTALLDRA